jgi:orotate phosphoribosyltransferase
LDQSEEEPLANFKEFLIEDGALVRGHYVYASGKHGEWYINKTAGFVLASHALKYARRIAEMAHFDLPRIEAVVGPEIGAIPFMADVRAAIYELEEKEVAGIMATKIPGTKSFEIVRDQARFLKGKRTLILEDVLTTGESAKNTVDAVRVVGGNPIAVAALWNRGGVTAESLGVSKLLALLNEQLPDYAAIDCPLCNLHIPINTDLGKGAEYLREYTQAQTTYPQYGP